VQLRPHPHPGVALFAVVLAFLGYVAFTMPYVRPIGVLLAVVAAYLLAKFLYGLRLERSLKRGEGQLAQARVTRIEERRNGKGRPALWWTVDFEMTDSAGVKHALSFDELQSLRWREGGTVMIRYHPVAPDRIFRVEKPSAADTD